jgi:short-subunit dehydrogenase
MPNALLTGANSGIGKEIAYSLASKGYKLTLVVRNSCHAIDFLDPKKVDFEVFVADLCNEDDRKHLLKKIDESSFDVVINNAGFGLYGPIVSHGFQEEKDLLEVNVSALFEITFKAIESFKNQGRKGTILNVSSVAAFFSPFPYFASYAASKLFVLSLSKSLDFELKSSGIRVLVSCPGPVKTPFRAKASKFKREESSNMMSAHYAAKRIVNQIERGQAVDIFNFPYRLYIFIIKLLPSYFIAHFLKNTIKRLMNSKGL